MKPETKKSIFRSISQGFQFSLVFCYFYWMFDFFIYCPCDFNIFEIEHDSWNAHRKCYRKAIRAILSYMAFGGIKDVLRIVPLTFFCFRITRALYFSISLFSTHSFCKFFSFSSKVQTNRSD